MHVSKWMRIVAASSRPACEAREWKVVTVEAMSRSCVKVSYSGRVQGVGFRHTVRSLAAGYELAGTIRNLPDGTVELVAEGTRDELEAFQEAIRDSGLGRFIENETARWHEARSQLRGFEIVR